MRKKHPISQQFLILQVKGGVENVHLTGPQVMLLLVN